MVKIINEYFNNFSLFIVTHEMVDLIRHDYLLEMKKMIIHDKARDLRPARLNMWESFFGKHPYH